MKNILTSIENAEIVRCGRKLSSLLINKTDEAHKLNIEKLKMIIILHFHIL